MTWVKLDDGFPEHAKVLDLSPPAAWLFVRGLCFCARNLTDGRLTERALWTLRASKKDRHELERCGLWEPHPDGGVVVHDYLDYQPSRAKVEADRDATAKRMRRHREKDNDSVTTSQDPPCNGDVTPSHTPSVTPSVRFPRPDPFPSPSGSVDLNRHPENLSGPPARDPETGSDGGISSDPGRETVCPLNLAEKAAAGGVLQELAEKLPAPLESVRHEAEDFVAYWTIGAGAQRKRTAWMAKLRQRIVDRHREGKLTPPGEIRHSEVRPIPMPKQPRKKRAPEPPLPSPEEQRAMAEMALESIRRPPGETLAGVEAARKAMLGR